jgi:hypothetical protein
MGGKDEGGRAMTPPVHLRHGFYAVELTTLGDQFKNLRILEADKRWSVPYLKYSYRSIYHTKRRGKDFFCSEEEPLGPGTWKIICTSKEATEDECAIIAGLSFQDVVHGWSRTFFHDHLTSKGLDPKNILIIQKM